MADRPVRAFVVGHPIAHSRSPIIHGHWLAELGISGSYERIDVAPSEFKAFIDSLPAHGYAGGNVTLPHKEAAHDLAQRRDEAAELIGAANTLWYEHGLLHAGNTDSYGFAAGLDGQAPAWRAAQTALVLGAGGAARAVLYALKQVGIVDIRIANRTSARAQALADRFGGGVAVCNWRDLDQASSGVDLLVNTTTLGMDGSEAVPLKLSGLATGAIVTDIVYVPLETPLLAAARKHGFVAVDGLWMLLHQAVPGFERWFGVRPSVTSALRARIVADLEPAP